MMGGHWIQSSLGKNDLDGENESKSLLQTFYINPHPPLLSLHERLNCARQQCPLKESTESKEVAMVLRLHCQWRINALNTLNALRVICICMHGSKHVHTHMHTHCSPLFLVCVVCTFMSFLLLWGLSLGLSAVLAPQGMEKEDKHSLMCSIFLLSATGKRAFKKILKVRCRM